MERKMHGFRARLDYVLKHNYAVNRLFNWSVSSFMKLWGLFVPTDEQMVMFSGHTRKYNDSPKALYEYMLAHPEAYGNYHCVWALEDPEAVEVPGNPTKIKADTLEYFKYTLKAKYWVTCVNIERSLHYKKRNCRYLNTWHGTPFKHIGNDAGVRKDYDFGSMDFFCYASDYEKEIYKRAFRVREEALIPTGLPRNDTLYGVTENEVKELKKKMGLPLDKKVILYAPTWRESNDKGSSYVIKPPVTAKKWEEALGKDYVVLFRMHAYSNKVLGIEFNDTIRDFSAYPDVNDLFKISDILISDYSASMADFSILERPVLCFAYDYEEYRKERGLYMDYEKEMPSGLLRTEDEVLRYIAEMDYERECEKTRDMLKGKLLQYGGHATKECLDILFEK